MSTPERTYRVESFGYSPDIAKIEARLNEISAEGWTLVTGAHNAALGHPIWVFRRTADE